jgi:phi13 family phage major tail protein
MSDWVYRGVENLVYAEVLVDTKDQFVTGEVKDLSEVAKIAKKIEQSMSTEHYSNRPLIIVRGMGGTNLEIVMTPPSLPTLAEITNQRIDTSHGALIEGGSTTEKYFALGYKYQGTDGGERYAWRLKGQFNIPDEEYNTKDNGTTTSNTTMTYASVDTVHKFSDGKSAGGVIVDSRLVNYGLDKFFNQVVTPDNMPTGYNGVLPPEFLPTTTTFTGSLKVTMAAGTTGGNIYYTLDGTNPSSESEAYTEPFTITETTTIKAYTSVGMTASPVATKTYVKVTT